MLDEGKDILNPDQNTVKPTVQVSQRPIFAKLAKEITRCRTVKNLHLSMLLLESTWWSKRSCVSIVYDRLTGSINAQASQFAELVVESIIPWFTEKAWVIKELMLQWLNHPPELTIAISQQQYQMKLRNPTWESTEILKLFLQQRWYQ